MHYVSFFFFKFWATTLKKECEDKWWRDCGVENDKHRGLAEQQEERGVLVKLTHHFELWWEIFEFSTEFCTICSLASLSLWRAFLIWFKCKFIKKMFLQMQVSRCVVHVWLCYVLVLFVSGWLVHELQWHTIVIYTTSQLPRTEVLDQYWFPWVFNWS